MSHNSNSSRPQSSGTSSVEHTRTMGSDDRSLEPDDRVPDPSRPRTFGPDDRGATNQSADQATTDPGEVVRMAHVELEEETQRNDGATETGRR